jgi:quinol monooxygenase YgiN
VIRHVVVVKFKPESAPDTIDEVVQELRELPSKVPVIREYEVGLDLNSGRALAIVGAFENKGSFEEYMQHPAHRAVADRHLRPITEAATSIQYEI